MNDAMKKHAIAIDGPSGAGKSTLARAAAKKLGFVYVDTGALYRAVGLCTFRARTDPKDREAVASLLPAIQLDVRYDEKGIQHVLLCGEDVSEAIRLPEISMYASDVSAHPPVRSFLLDTQRNFAERYNVVMDGRDIGTVVLPDADLKIFLTASAEARAKRRLLELRAKGISAQYGEVLKDMKLRDFNDSNRAAAPLRAAEDAVLLDTTSLDAEQALQRILELVEVKHWNLK